MSAIKALIISVKSARARRLMQERQLHELGIDGTIMDAVTPKDISDADLKKLTFSWARPLGPGEVACALSHKKAWAYAAEQDKPTLILEDDVLLSHDTQKVLEAISFGPNLGHISLEYYDQAKLLGKAQPLEGLNYNLCKLYHDRGGAAAYVLWPEAAKRFLDANKNRTPLADAAMNLTPFLQMHQLEPACAVQANVMARKHPEFAQLDVTQMVLPAPRPAYPSRLQFFTCKLRRLSCSLFLLGRQIQALGRATKRHITYTVTPETLKRSEDFS